MFFVPHTLELQAVKQHASERYLEVTAKISHVAAGHTRRKCEAEGKCTMAPVRQQRLEV